MSRATNGSRVLSNMVAARAGGAPPHARSRPGGRRGDGTAALDGGNGAGPSPPRRYLPACAPQACVRPALRRRPIPRLQQAGPAPRFKDGTRGGTAGGARGRGRRAASPAQRARGAGPRALRPISAEAPPPAAEPAPSRTRGARVGPGASPTRCGGGAATCARAAGVVAPRGARPAPTPRAGCPAASRAAGAGPVVRPPSAPSARRGRHRGLQVRPNRPNPPLGTSRRGCAAGASPLPRARALGRREQPRPCPLPVVIFHPCPGGGTGRFPSRARASTAVGSAPSSPEHRPPRPGLGSPSQCPRSLPPQRALRPPVPGGTQGRGSPQFAGL